MASNHPFEVAGLGLAPFQFDGMTEITFQAYPGAPVVAGGSCDYCGTGIRQAFWIKSADGKRFKVGCDCVEKTCKPGGPIVTAAQKELRRHQKAVKLARLKIRAAAAAAILAAHPGFLADLPSEWGDGRGGKQTARQMVEFLLDRGGAKGRTQACKIIEYQARASGLSGAEL